MVDHSLLSREGPQWDQGKVFEAIPSVMSSFDINKRIKGRRASASWRSRGKRTLDEMKESVKNFMVTKAKQNKGYEY